MFHNPSKILFFSVSIFFLLLISVFLIFFVLLPKLAFATDEGPRFAGTTINDAGIGSIAWTTPENAATSNDSYATASGSAASNYSKASDFGFSIPGGATINGILVEWEVASDGAATNDNAARIVKGGTIGSTDRSNATFWTGTDTFLSHGGSSDLWGETWTASDINDTFFGAALSALISVPGSTRIDSVRITVTYNGGGGVPPSPPTFNQKRFKIYKDNAGLNSADSYAAQDTNYNVGLNTNFRIRFQVANTGIGIGEISRRLEFKEDSGPWMRITNNTNNVRLSDSSNFTDGDSTASRLTATGTFAAGQGKDTSSDTAKIYLYSGYYTEDEYSLMFQPTAAGHSYQFRIINAGNVLDVYTVIPTIIPDSSPPIPSGFNPVDSSTIRTPTPNITFSLNEDGDCRASTTNSSYDNMSQSTICTVAQSTQMSCQMTDLGANGPKTIYFACQDIFGNKDTQSTTHSVTYALNSSSSSAPSLMIKGLIKIIGGLIMR